MKRRRSESRKYPITFLSLWKQESSFWWNKEEVLKKLVKSFWIFHVVRNSFNCEPAAAYFFKSFTNETSRWIESLFQDHFLPYFLGKWLVHRCFLILMHTKRRISFIFYFWNQKSKKDHFGAHYIHAVIGTICGSG